MKQIILATEQNIGEGIVGGLMTAIVATVLFKLKLTTKVFARTDYDIKEFLFILATMAGWMTVWLSRKSYIAFYNYYDKKNQDRKKYNLSMYINE
tara:strand:+ start:3156 stop:3440 length:285 start_codon:yes stop_codon:yes gene_type:complete